MKRAGVGRTALCLFVLALAACERQAAAPSFEAPVVIAGVEVSAETMNRGEQVFARYCASCHGADGSGQGPAAAGLKVQPRDLRSCRYLSSGEDESSLPQHTAIVGVIERGIVDRGMPAWRGLNPGDLESVARYVEHFCPRYLRNEAEVAPSDRGAPPA